ncbi:MULTISPECIES: DUF4395 family protein [unclassified Microbacterium]|uniref:DUF4395 family protein n=1 Tax=unclassified Microbacterium TaxID=2609290 RepID=UPI000493B522|nr:MULTISPECIES: DUF4395 family protein [unclassified Microbacterium]MCV0333402.1 DUF4395 domain-containing protein [Microbacterium sp.]MCV0374682.1 DUF4395 domain-containing protein [Microbacterium sp.]MCV0388798.1 DUF4395 domain-containing protein [Microbacterium sp.]MCV0417326.1 DUF4395 domain-containing protein [Microbacterium sp.]MCV0420637.1 DUF4395 domain-containing protein [Microbacterium sp.]
MSTPAGIDPRGPRFAAAITAVLLLVATFLALIGISTLRTGIASFGWFAYQPLADATFVPSGWAISSAPLLQRALDPGFLLTVVIALLFLWGLVSPQTAPWATLFRSAIRPRLAAPTELEDPRPPRFSQGVGLFVVGVGLVLHLLGVPWALPIATSAAFIAAFLNAAFAFCLGCQLYLLLQRAGVVGREATPA